MAMLDTRPLPASFLEVVVTVLVFVFVLGLEFVLLLGRSLYLSSVFLSEYRHCSASQSSTVSTSPSLHLGRQ